MIRLLGGKTGPRAHNAAVLYKFGLSWQIVPRVMIKLLQDKDPAKAQRVMRAMMQMTKIDIAELQRAYRG